ncbi:MAG: hypothetical protein KGJ11_09160, partial [Candidatus Omnitrophica bacterium]|nr:hypothetical protein [Candidatus Omnitrophota bacterium]
VVQPQPQGQKKMTLVTAVGVWVATIILAVILSALSTLWPIDKYILLLGNLLIGRGQWDTALPLLTAYIAVSMWPLWLVWAFVSIKNLRLSWLKIVGAAVFLTASTCMVLIFK